MSLSNTTFPGDYFIIMLGIILIVHAAYCRILFISLVAVDYLEKIDVVFVASHITLDASSHEAR